MGTTTTLVIFIVLSVTTTVQVKALGEDCSAGKDCPTNEICSVDDICVCDAASGFKTISGTCRLPRHGETCETACEAPFVCEDNNGTKTCSCSITQYYVSETGQCENKKSFDVSCSTSTECQETLTCYVDVCVCDRTTQYRDEALCRARKERDQHCYYWDECKDTLTCISNKCDCDATSQYYTGSKCEQKNGYGRGCHSTSECLGTLSCIGGFCNCNHVTQYREGNECKSRKGYPGSCGSTSECLGTLSCIGGRCNCNHVTHYRDGNECKSRKLRTQSCSYKINECADTLDCVYSKCYCEITRYFNNRNGQCELKKGHGEHCTQIEECMDFNAECSSNKCLCKSSHYHPSQGSQSCGAMTQLKVKELKITSRLVDAISMSWSSDVLEPTVHYRINHFPSDGSQVVDSSKRTGTLSGLTPGTKYTISIVSYLPSSSYYNEKSTSVVAPDTWTLPSLPGAYVPSQSQLLVSPTVFKFTAATGNVATYNFLLRKHGRIVLSKTVATNKVVDFTPLIVETTYEYQISTVNGHGDKSALRREAFTTVAAAFEQVQGLTIKDKGVHSVRVEWNPPPPSNGQIHAFFLQLLTDDSCIAASYFLCTDCDSNEVPQHPECGQPKHEGGFTTGEVDAYKTFHVTVDSLTSYTEYSVRVFAANKEGSGAFDETTFTTDESAAEDLVELNVNSYRENSNKSVGLKVEWIPGRKTGQTNYFVFVVDEMDVDGDIVPRKVVGYEKRMTLFGDLLAYHTYDVDVYAETGPGKSNFISEVIKTKTAIPGAVRNLTVIPDVIFAKRMKLEFNCPPKPEWNGDFQGVDVIKSTSGDQTRQTTFSVHFNDCIGVKTFYSDQFGEFEIKMNYSFVVKTKNQDFDSEPSSAVYFYTAPKAPVFSRSILTKHSELKATKKTVSVSLCSSCLTDESQGEIIEAGLIVCVKHKAGSCTNNRRKRAALTVDDFQRYVTWAKAKSDDFTYEYRTTPDNWTDILKQDMPKTFVIGDNQTCSDDPNQLTYCNGPLPSGKEIIVAAVSCTEAGCQSQSTPGFALKTQAFDNGASDDSTGMIAGIVVAVVVVVIIAAVAVVVFFRTRRRNKK